MSLFIRKLVHKCFSLKSLSNHHILRSSHKHAPKEVTIKMPWGHIAGMHWNESSSAIPVLCLHGWKDNAGSFNNLIPAILENTTKYQFLAIDLPGHGLSSYYPPGMLYQVVDTMIFIRRILRHFGWEDRKEGIHLIGHSLGAILGFIFTASHPKLVHSLIAIDALVPVTFAKADLVSMIHTCSEGYLHMETKDAIESRAKTYEKQQLLDKFHKSHLSGIDETCCSILLTRGVIETPSNSNKYRFAHDPRVQFFPMMGFSSDQIEYLAKGFKSNLLHIKAENGVTYISDSLEARIKRWIAQDNKGTVKFVLAKQATHHVHLGEPQKIIKNVMQSLS